jgi:hypothetical protein
MPLQLGAGRQKTRTLDAFTHLADTRDTGGGAAPFRSTLIRAAFLFYGQINHAWDLFRGHFRGPLESRESRAALRRGDQRLTFREKRAGSDRTDPASAGAQV